MTATSNPAPRNPAPTVSTPMQATQVANRLIDAMNALLKIVEEETALVRHGKVAQAMTLESQKTELSQTYSRAIGDLRANQPYMTKSTPDILRTLRRHHDQFRAILQMNLTVLATAHAVSEGIVRGVNSELQKKSAPQTYTAGGQHSASGLRHAAPLTVSRSL
jgi:hypothetical protein